VAASGDSFPQESSNLLSNDWESVARIREALISENLHRLGCSLEAPAEPPPPLRRNRDERAAHREMVRNACESNVRVTANSGEVPASLSEEAELSHDSSASCGLLPVSVPEENTP
jgi:hypothetical protein